MPIQERELVDEDSAEDVAAGGDQPAGGHLAAAVEDALELAVEVLDRPRAKLMEDPTDLDPAVGVRGGAAPGGDQLPAIVRAPLAQVRVVVIGVAQQEAKLRRQLRQQARGDLVV